jgi:hypothetical protein
MLRSSNHPAVLADRMSLAGLKIRGNAPHGEVMWRWYKLLVANANATIWRKRPRNAGTDAMLGQKEICDAKRTTQVPKDKKTNVQECRWKSEPMQMLRTK